MTAIMMGTVVKITLAAATTTATPASQMLSALLFLKLLLFVIAMQPRCCQEKISHQRQDAQIAAGALRVET